MATVLLRLSGPMQAYGTSSHWEERATRSRPTKSAVIGLIVNALGLSADTPLDDFTSMTFAVRADRPGRQMRDEQTAGGGRFLQPTRETRTQARTMAPPATQP